MMNPSYFNNPQDASCHAVHPAVDVHAVAPAGVGCGYQWKAQPFCR